MGFVAPPVESQLDPSTTFNITFTVDNAVVSGLRNH
jgi:hypothetical protein